MKRLVSRQQPQGRRPAWWAFGAVVALSTLVGSGVDLGPGTGTAAQSLSTGVTHAKSWAPTRSTTTTTQPSSSTTSTTTTTQPSKAPSRSTTTTTQAMSSTTSTTASTTQLQVRKIASSGSMPTAPPAGYKTLYQNDFSSGVLGPEWYRYWGQPGGDPAGWWSPSHVDVSQGALTERTYQDQAHYGGTGTPWVEGGVALYKIGFQSGEVLVHTRLTEPNGVAMTLALWPSAANNWPPEIDFSETTGGSQAYAFLHWRSSSGIQTASAKAPNVDLTQWHTWGVVVTPSKVTYTLDGVPWATTANQQSQTMHLCIQQEVYGAGNPDRELPPGPSEPSEVDLDVAWVAVYVPS